MSIALYEANRLGAFRAGQGRMQSALNRYLNDTIRDFIDSNPEVRRKTILAALADAAADTPDAQDRLAACMDANPAVTRAGND